MVWDGNKMGQEYNTMDQDGKTIGQKYYKIMLDGTKIV